MRPIKLILFGLVLIIFHIFDNQIVNSFENDFDWPKPAKEAKPATYWWWMGSAVDKENISRELTTLAKAGFGGVHIIPIYGVRGWEKSFIPYLSDEWLDVLVYTINESKKLDMFVDMTMGTGWCFGGPSVNDSEANASVVVKQFTLNPGESFKEKLNKTRVQAIVGFDKNGGWSNLIDALDLNGVLKWQTTLEPVELFIIEQKPSGQRVKRAAPGGEGHMLNLFYLQSMRNYLQWFEDAFKKINVYPRALYHDSYEYRSDWSPDLLSEFAKRRGYKLESKLNLLFSKTNVSDDVSRVKSDYRETLSDMMIENTLPLWVKWCHDHNIIVRNEAHGSPGNILDLYALADIPETEMFRDDRNILISKFASSASHVMGKKYTSSETGTWLKEHFTGTLADMKTLIDDLFLSGVNHIFYHGTCYSPKNAEWPGWQFYASFEMNDRNPIWYDVPALNSYVTRVQSVLQLGVPDNKVLLYWPIYDFWHNASGMVQQLTVHAKSWFENQPICRCANLLWTNGYSFDYISDRQLNAAEFKNKKIITPGAEYDVIVVPGCTYMPLNTLERLIKLADSGATIIFETKLPDDVPGFCSLAERRASFRRLLAKLKNGYAVGDMVKYPAGNGMIIVGELVDALQHIGMRPEEMVVMHQLNFVRRKFNDDYYYFIVNKSKTNIEAWVPITVQGKSVLMMDPLTGCVGIANTRNQTLTNMLVLINLPAGHSVVLKVLTSKECSGDKWKYWKDAGPSRDITGSWKIDFIQGGPILPSTKQIDRLVSWTELNDPETESFAGTAKYTTKFDLHNLTNRFWKLNLGKVCNSARVYLNGTYKGTVFMPPFEVIVDNIKSNENLLEIEVTNIAANRIRDLDRRKIKWRAFYDINYVNIDYKQFDASDWPVAESGLLGPVTLTPITLHD